MTEEERTVILRRRAERDLQRLEARFAMLDAVGEAAKQRLYKGKKQKKHTVKQPRQLTPTS